MREKRKLTGIVAGMLISAAILTGCNSTESDKPWEYETEDDYQKLVEIFGQTTAPSPATSSSKAKETTHAPTTTQPQQPENQYPLIREIKKKLNIGYFQNGAALFQTYDNELQGLVNKKGEIFFQTTKDYSGVLNANGFYCFLEDEVWLYDIRISSPKILSYPDGKVVFKLPTNTDAITTPKNGYFWVRTVNKSLSGNSFTMTYYNTNCEKVFSIDNATCTTLTTQSSSNINFSSQYCPSHFNQYGYAILEINGEVKMINTKGEIITPILGTVDSEYSRKDRNKFIISSLDSDSTMLTVKNSGIIYTGIMDYSTFTYRIIKVREDNLGAYGCFGDKLIYLNYDWEKGRNATVYDENFNVIFNLVDSPSFAAATRIESCIVSEGLIIAGLRNQNNDLFYSIIDLEGNIILQPTVEIVPSTLSYEYGQDIFDKQYHNANSNVYARFSSGLCPAKDVSTGKYGYLDKTGKWAIEPTYYAAGNFSDGVACVNGNIMIDTTGNGLFIFNITFNQ